MGTNVIAEALIREHHEIDAGIERFIARTGESASSADGEDAREAARPLLGAFIALRRHIYLEEEFVFPAITDPSLAMAMQVMYREHGSIWRLMDSAEALLTDEAAGAREVVSACEQMLVELERHNAKEEPIIYPLADTALPEDRRNDLAEFLDSGHLPAGWKCREASGNTKRELPF